MKKIAFATCMPFPDIDADDVPLIEELARAGYQVVAAPWDDPGIEWNTFVAIVIRSTWNYYTQKEKFGSWLSLLAENKLQVFNPVEILKWNMDKRYLAALQDAGIPVPELHYFKAGTHADLPELFRTTGWQKAVVKPCVSAIAFNTWITTPGQADDTQKLNALLQEREYIVQEFMEEILSDGEYSLIFFSGRYSHAVKKMAASGDFRVQERFGGVITSVQPDERTIQQARQVVDALKLATPLLYARVDGVVRDQVFHLMELELVEPTLFFKDDPGVIKRFVDALLQKINASVVPA